MLVYYAGVVLNRVVPEAVFRFRYVHVLQLRFFDDSDRFSAETGLDQEEIQVRVLQEHELRELASVTGNRLSSDLIRKHKAVGVWKGDELLGGFWAAREEFTEMELGIQYHLAPNQVWGYSAFIDKSIRGRGWYQKTLSTWCKELARVGHPIQLVAVNPWNKISLNVHRQNAKRCLARIFAMRLFNCTICWTLGESTQSKYISLDARSRPIAIWFHDLEVEPIQL